MSDHQKETAFLRRLILLADSDARRELEERLGQVQRDECCVKRRALVMAVLAALAGAGVAYSAVLQTNFPYGELSFALKLLLEIEAAALISLAGFGCMLMVYRKRLNRIREECRRLATKALESNPSAFLVR
jgi:hypothetical protein